jgi:hypothetical protein
MSGQLTIRQKLIRIIASAAVCGLSMSFIVGESVDHKATLLKHWQSDPRILPESFLPLRPAQALYKATSQIEWKEELIAKNSAPGTPPPNYVMLREVAPASAAPIANDNVVVAQAAPALAHELPSQVKQAPKAEVRVPASTPFTDLAAKLVVGPPAPASSSFTAVVANPPALSSKPAAVAAAAPVKAASVGAPAKIALNDKVNAGDVERILQSMRDVKERVSAYPRKQASALMAAATISFDTKEKLLAVVDPAQQIKPGKISEKLAVIVGDASSAAEEIAIPSKVEDISAAISSAPAGANWQIHGRIQAPASLPKGHFEVGLFSKIDQDGIPIGFPLVQQILPAGVHRFDLKVPGKLDKGFLYGEFVAAKTGKRTWIAPPLNPWLRTERQVAELVFQEEDSITTVAAAGTAASETFKISGSVGTLFAKAGSPIPQEEVLIKVRGRKDSTRTNKDGSFHLEIPRVKGSINLEFMKAGYNPSVVSVPANSDGVEVKVELASREAVEQVARMLGIRQITSKGVFLGKAINADGSGLKGLSVRSSVKAEGPFYFTDEGFPSTSRKATSTDGRFIYFNLDSGTGYMEASLSGEPIAPFQFSTVEGGEMVMKELVPETGSIRGRLFNPVSMGARLQPLPGARVRVEGGAEFAVTDSYGAFTVGPMKWMRGERVFLEMSAEKFNNHRFSIIPGTQKAGLNLYAFPAVYISRLAESMDVDIDPYAGVVMGKVTGGSVRIDALADHSPINGAKDFYFDAKGKLRGSHTMTDPHFGTYAIFNVPKGRTILQGNDSAGTLRYSESVVSSPSSVSVIME